MKPNSKQKKGSYFSIALLALVFIVFSNCEKKQNDDFPMPDSNTAGPKLKITSPEIPQDGLKPEAGSTVSFTLNLNAAAGLSAVYANQERIKIYDGTAKKAILEYTRTIKDLTPLNLIFKLEDALKRTASATPISIKPVKPKDPSKLLIIDFSGEEISSAEVEYNGWDTRKEITFRVTGDVTNEAIGSVPGNQAVISCAQDNPDTKDPVKKVMKIEKIPQGNNWGGWAHVFFKLENPVPQNAIEKLPAYAKEGASKVVKIDVYYDTSVDTNWTWEYLTGLSGIWNSDPSKGYKIDLALANFEKHSVNQDNKGYYVCYSAYISEPDKWVTLTFDSLDTGREEAYDGEGDDNLATSDEVDCFDFKLSPGYEEKASIKINKNPVYFKNLRIVDKE